MKKPIQKCDKCKCRVEMVKIFIQKQNLYTCKLFCKNIKCKNYYEAIL